MDTKHFETKLKAEYARLTAELQSLGRIDPSNKDNWETTYSDLRSKTGALETSPEPDPIDSADLIEEYETRTAVEIPLEIQWNVVKQALARIVAGTYGTCTVGNAPHPIETARLEANPAASTCIAHLNSTATTP